MCWGASPPAPSRTSSPTPFCCSWRGGERLRPSPLLPPSPTGCIIDSLPLPLPDLLQAHLWIGKDCFSAILRIASDAHCIAGSGRLRGTVLLARQTVRSASRFRLRSRRGSARRHQSTDRDQGEASAHGDHRGSKASTATHMVRSREAAQGQGNWGFGASNPAYAGIRCGRRACWNAFSRDAPCPLDHRPV